MTHRRWWVVGVVVALVQCWVTIDARQILPYEGGALGVLVLVAVGVGIVRRRWRRGSRPGARPPVADGLTGLHDAMLVRLPVRDDAPIDTGPTATAVESHDDPLGDLTAGTDDDR
jgi:hypothetical protein